TAYGDVNIQLREDDHDDDWIQVAAPGGQELESLFRRVNNAFIGLLRIGFLLEELPFPYYLRANADDLQCQTDYALVDFLCFHLKPQVFEMWRAEERYEDYVMRFTHDVFRGHIKHLVYE
ncbi:hypothetical protein AAVH_33419, partial [Aphelenchoides avenae]